MKFATHIELVGSAGIVTRIHAEYARRLILSGKGMAVRNGKRIVAVQLPTTPCGQRDSDYHGGNSLRQHMTEAHDGGKLLMIETHTPLASGQMQTEQRIVGTRPCRVFALKRSSRVLGEVLSAERAELVSGGAA